MDILSNPQSKLCDWNNPIKNKKNYKYFFKKNVLTFFKSVIQVIKLETLNLENSQSSILKTKNIK